MPTGFPSRLGLLASPRLLRMSFGWKQKRRVKTEQSRSLLGTAHLTLELSISGPSSPEGPTFRVCKYSPQLLSVQSPVLQAVRVQELSPWPLWHSCALGKEMRSDEKVKARNLERSKLKHVKQQKAWCMKASSLRLLNTCCDGSWTGRVCQERLKPHPWHPQEEKLTSGWGNSGETS